MTNKRQPAERAKHLCSKYVAALSSSDMEAMRRLFAPDAIVTSPIYGRQPFDRFYAQLFDETQQSNVTMLSTFVGVDTPQIAMQMEYQWILANGNSVRFHCVDVFDYCENRGLFTGLQIIYDTWAARRALDR